MPAVASKAYVISGEPVARVDYTVASTALAGADVRVIGTVPLVAHTSAAIGKIIGMAAGGCVYECLSGAALVVGVKAWYRPSNGKMYSTPTTSDVHFGFVAPDGAAAGADVSCKILHMPQATVT
jgi:hypothetical protein